MPEVSLADREMFNAHFVSVVAGELPGFVMRQAYVGENDAMGYATTDLLLKQIESDIPVHRPKSGTMRFEVPRPDVADLTFHIDDNDARAPDTQVNFYIMRRGTVFSALVPVVPALRTRIQNGDQEDIPALTPQDKVEFTNRRVYSGMFLPVMHTAVLATGDVLVFTDALHGHSFESLTFPRVSVVNLLYARLTQGDEPL